MYPPLGHVCHARAARLIETAASPRRSSQG
jgi:hypothetical protein